MPTPIAERIAISTWSLHRMLGTTYPHDLTGLVTCYTAALPFFKHSLIGMAVYSTAMFGGFALLEQRVPALQRQAVS